VSCSRSEELVPPPPTIPPKYSKKKTKIGKMALDYLGKFTRQNLGSFEFPLYQPFMSISPHLSGQLTPYRRGPCHKLFMAYLVTYLLILSYQALIFFQLSCLTLMSPITYLPTTLLSHPFLSSLS
jgi:hypothetical protein